MTFFTEEGLPAPPWADVHEVLTDAVRIVHGAGPNYYVYSSTILRGQYGEPRRNFLFEFTGGEWNGKKFTKRSKHLITGVELDEAKERVEARKANDKSSKD